jgi:hypothetical protein
MCLQMDKFKKINAVIFPEPRVCTVGKVGIPRISSTDVLVDIEFSSVSIGTERWCLTANLEIPGNPPMAFPHVPGYQAGTLNRVIEYLPGIAENRKISEAPGGADMWEYTSPTINLC